jgi:hypothetical protein
MLQAGQFLKKRCSRGSTHHSLYFNYQIIELPNYLVYLDNNLPDDKTLHIQDLLLLLL